MAGFLLVCVIHHDVRNRSGFLRTRFAPRFRALVRLLAIGLPAALQVTLEVGVFAAATTLAGKLDPVSLAAHHVVLRYEKLAINYVAMWLVAVMEKALVRLLPNTA